MIFVSVAFLMALSIHLYREHIKTYFCQISKGLKVLIDMYSSKLVQIWFCGQKGLNLDVTELICEVTELICGCYCSLILPHSAVVWSAMCECDIFLAILTFWSILQYF